jgi:hypothetical protein
MSYINYSDNNNLKINDHNYTTINNHFNETVLILHWIIGIFCVIFFIQITIIIYVFQKNVFSCFNKYFNIFRRCKRKEMIIEMGTLSHEVKN